MRLLYSYSVPILTYDGEVKAFSHSDMGRCNTALNDAIRRIFSFHRWESIRTLRSEFGYKDLTTTFAIRRRKFMAMLSHMDNKTVTSLHHYILALLYAFCLCATVNWWRIQYHSWGGRHRPPKSTFHAQWSRRHSTSAPQRGLVIITIISAVVRRDWRARHRIERVGERAKEQVHRSALAKRALQNKGIDQGDGAMSFLSPVHPQRQVSKVSPECCSAVSRLGGPIFGHFISNRNRNWYWLSLFNHNKQELEKKKQNIIFFPQW